MNWYTALLLVGVVQGLFFSLAIWTQTSNNRQANRLLALFVFAFAIILLNVLLNQSKMTAWAFKATHVLWPAAFMIGPLFWWYTKSIIDVEFNFDQKQLPHFIPSDISLMAALSPLLLNIDAVQQNFISAVDAGVVRVELMISVAVVAIVIHSGTYIAKSINYIRKHSSTISNTLSLNENINLRWLIYMALTCFGVWVLFLLSQVLEGQYGETFTMLVTLEMVAILFIVGFFATRQQGAAFLVPIQARYVKQQPASDKILAKTTPSKYQSSNLSAVQSKAIEYRLLALMKDKKPYLTAKLTLPQLADQLNTQPNYLSQVINERLERNFLDFVNHYRIEEAQRRLIAEPHRSILDIAFDAGFNSKSVFYKAFKQKCGMTPSQFRQANTAPFFDTN